MKKDDLNKIASIESAITKKYGEEAVQNPQRNWDEAKEKDYLLQMKKFYQKVTKNEEWKDKVDVNGIKVTKKLLNRESLITCPTCGSFPKKSMDDVCLIKFGCCNNCYIEHIEGRDDPRQRRQPQIKKDKE